MKILIPVDGSANAQRAVEHVIANIAKYKEKPQLLLLNVQWNIATGNVKLFINQQTIDDYYREQGIAALQKARAALDAAGLPCPCRSGRDGSARAGRGAGVAAGFGGEQGIAFGRGSGIVGQIARIKIQFLPLPAL